MIERLDSGAYVIGSGGRWLPGIYADERAARYAFRFADEVLVRVRDEQDRPVTFEDLRAARRAGTEWAA